MNPSSQGHTHGNQGHSSTCAACSLVLGSCSACHFRTCPTLLIGKGLEGSLTVHNYIGCAKPQYRCVTCVKKFALSSDVKVRHGCGVDTLF